jgi:hypothetical protein
MTLLRRSVSSLLILLGAGLTACVVPGSGTLSDSDLTDGTLPWGEMAFEELDGEPAFAFESEPRGLIEAPSEVLAFVGHDLSFDVYAVDPSLGRIAAGTLPANATFEDDDDGGSLHWSPQMDDVGNHILVFLLMDAVEPDLVIAQTSVSVHVLPVNKLIEYGF